MPQCRKTCVSLCLLTRIDEHRGLVEQLVRKWLELSVGAHVAIWLMLNSLKLRAVLLPTSAVCT
jgi:hypothetical protein